MNDESINKDQAIHGDPLADRMTLPVLPSSDKAAQLKEELATEALASATNPPATETVAPPSRHPTPLDFGHALHTSPAGLSAAQRSIEATVVEVIRTIYDPEIPVNIYDLGLIYEIDVDAENHVKVKMTLTAPGCPVAGSLPVEVEKKIEAIPEVKGADVELVWEPQWDKSRMSEAAVLDLGLF